ncbi:hypothetical protein LBMAG43_05540 [Methylococcaceae bacterium]|nr:hypothetical protein LBMAG43_05540 [Methylococcaceae bacterium]
MSGQWGPLYDCFHCLSIYSPDKIDGWLEEYEKILVSVFYDGRECEIHTEDNGQDLRRIITLSIFDDNNEEEVKVVLDQNGEEDIVIDFDY